MDEPYNVIIGYLLSIYELSFFEFSHINHAVMSVIILSDKMRTENTLQQNMKGENRI